MKPERLGKILWGIGLIPVAIALLKLFVLGFTDSELAPTLVVLGVGAALCFWGNRTFVRARKGS